MRRFFFAATSCVAISLLGSSAPSAQPSVTAAEPGERPSGLLFRESFDDSGLLQRGWYDGNAFTISEEEPHSSTGSIEYHWKAGTTTPDGVVRGWFDGKLVIDHADVVLRSTDFPKMQFNQFLLTPYFGPGLLPHEQTLWIDDLAVGTKRVGAVD